MKNNNTQQASFVPKVLQTGKNCFINPKENKKKDATPREQLPQEEQVTEDKSNEGMSISVGIVDNDSEDDAEANEWMLTLDVCTHY